MNILLLNDNPVVTKLVTLSAQKTGSEIFIASNIDEVQGDSYDLIIVDEALYSLNLMDELKLKIAYKHSLYMLSRGAQSVDEFDYEVKKPFLPTDLVELLSSISSALVKIDDESMNPDDVDSKEDLDMDKDLKSEVFIDSGIIDDDLDLDNIDLNLDEIGLDNLSIKDDEIGSILDQDEVQEVKNLLDEAELQEDELDLDNELNIDDVEFDNEKSLLPSDHIEIEDDFSFDENDLNFDTLEDEIQNAVGALSQDDLDQEIDLNFDDLDEFASLDEKSLKIALGEEVEDINEDELILDDELFSEAEHELGEEIVPTIKEELPAIQTDGVDALKTLLKALSNEDVVASLKGMNVSINISFGNNSDK